MHSPPNRKCITAKAFFAALPHAWKIFMPNLTQGTI